MTETIWLRGEGGALLTVSLPLHFSIADRLAKGQLQRCNRDGALISGPIPEAEAEPEPAPEPQDSGEDGTAAMPKRTASQAEWATYAISQGMDPAEAHGMKRDELYVHYRRKLRAVS